jgi:hypothetical protein
MAPRFDALFGMLPDDDGYAVLRIRLLYASAVSWLNLSAEEPQAAPVWKVHAAVSVDALASTAKTVADNEDLPRLHPFANQSGLRRPARPGRVVRLVTGQSDVGKLVDAADARVVLRGLEAKAVAEGISPPGDRELAAWAGHPDQSTTADKKEKGGS